MIATTKAFVLSDENNFPILGNTPLSLDNVFISQYPVILGDKRPEQLEVDETTKVSYNHGGSPNICYIQRIS